MNISLPPSLLKILISSQLPPKHKVSLLLLPINFNEIVYLKDLKDIQTDICAPDTQDSESSEI